MTQKDNFHTPLKSDESEIIKAILDSSYDAIVILDSNQRVIYASKAVERISGLIPDKIIGKTISELIKKKIIDKESVTEQVYKTKTRLSSLLQLQPKSKLLLTTATPHFDQSNNINYVIVNIRNVIELFSLECDLEINSRRTTSAEIYYSKLQSKIRDAGIKDFVIASNATAEIIEMILSLIPYELNYLITGETGTGKGLLAKTIHALSLRKHRPFIEINCSAIPADLLETELFGYTEGAFTGAKKQGQPGLLELANKGIMFFDEIGLMPLSLQSKILTFLDDKKIRRLGSSNSIDLDVQIIAATNKDINKAKEDGSFRKDLYFRLNEINIEIPPLHKRTEDLNAMIEYFWGKFNKEFNKRAILEDSALNYLKLYHYPGNVREMRNIIKRLIVKAKKPVVEVNDISKEIILSEIVDPNLEPEDFDKKKEFRDKITSYEKNIIEMAYQKYGSTYSAAKALGMTQSTFFRKLKKYLIQTS